MSQKYKMVCLNSPVTIDKRCISDLQRCRWQVQMRPPSGFGFLPFLQLNLVLILRSIQKHTMLHTNVRDILTVQNRGIIWGFVFLGHLLPLSRCHFQHLWHRRSSFISIQFIFQRPTLLGQVNALDGEDLET